MQFVVMVPLVLVLLALLLTGTKVLLLFLFVNSTITFLLDAALFFFLFILKRGDNVIGDDNRLVVSPNCYSPGCECLSNAAVQNIFRG